MPEGQFCIQSGKYWQPVLAGENWCDVILCLRIGDDTSETVLNTV